MRSSGRTTPSSSAAAARITLNVEPGSKGSVTARLRQWSFDGASRKVFGLNVGRVAAARTAPGRGPGGRVRPDEGSAGRARELGVEGALDPLEAAVHALESDDVRGELAVRIEAQRLGEEAEAGLAQRAHLGGPRGRGASPGPTERA